MIDKIVDLVDPGKLANRLLCEVDFLVDEKLLRELKLVEAALKQKELVQVMIQVRDILDRQGGGRDLAVFG